MARIAIPDFQLANAIYAGATVTFFTVTDAGVKTTTAATLYDDFTGTGTFANPVTLDGEGKFAQIPYIDAAVIGAVTGLSVPDHDTGVVTAAPAWRDDWVTATVYYPNDFVRDGSNGDDTKDLYVVVSQHTSGTWATDAADSTKLALALDISGLATTLPAPANPGDDDKFLQAIGGAGVWAGVITAYAKTVLDDANAAAAQVTLELEPGVDVQAFDADMLKADTADDLTAGFTSTSSDQGTKSSGTFTPAFATRNVQRYVNGGAHTLAPPSSGEGTLVLQATNDGSAGAVTVSGFTVVTGDSLTTTNGDDFLFFITVVNSFSHLHAVALQ